MTYRVEFELKGVPGYRFFSEWFDNEEEALLFEDAANASTGVLPLGIEANDD